MLQKQSPDQRKGSRQADREALGRQLGLPSCSRRGSPASPSLQPCTGAPCSQRVAATAQLPSQRLKAASRSCSIPPPAPAGRLAQAIAPGCEVVPGRAGASGTVGEHGHQAVPQSEPTWALGTRGSPPSRPPAAAEGWDPGRVSPAAGWKSRPSPSSVRPHLRATAFCKQTRKA